ncbi:hypothetical protein CAPTEDRAFT_194462 [Capitella teleta]|uniref:Uncharacterized protein n=1 Tax=Capitella teleta TaxID=283909 RepID=R7UTT1_CAPTE|nr:hypothetical protein CAPTEDRAFT_194462 [Capitella teleta]|eukprot:ELU06816.1 hypothetical protein CAPTEDRAFT_194462 [Capitella teleta]
MRSPIELLTPKQNGAAQEDGASCSGTGRDSPSLSKAPAKGSIRGLWKKAFKSMKPEKSEKNTNTVSAAAEGGEDSSDNRPEKPKRQSSLKKGLRRKDSKEKEAAAGAVGGGDRFDSEDRPDSSDNPQEIDPVYSLLKCAADLPRQGGKGGSTGHDCCPRGIGIGTNGSSSRGSSPASGEDSQSTTSCSCPCHHPELLEGYHTKFLNSFVIKKKTSCPMIDIQVIGSAIMSIALLEVQTSAATLQVV